MRFVAAFTAALFASGVFSIPQTSSIRKRCVNSAADRSCWADDFDLTTDYYTNVPETGETVEVRPTSVIMNVVYLLVSGLV